MPGYASIVNYLLRLFPDDATARRYKSALKLSPQSENLADPALTQAVVRDNLAAWHSRAAVEALRGWKWPFWINAQMNPAGAAFAGAAFQPMLTNTVARDAAIIPGLSGRFAGTMDRRGMITPRGARFSIVVWFRLGDRMITPSEILEERDVSFAVGPERVTFFFVTGRDTISITAAADAIDGFEFLTVRAGVSGAGETGHEVPSEPVAIYIAIRPYNLQSVVPLHDLVYNSKGFWMSENRIIGWFSLRPEIAWASDARHGDAALFLSAPPERTAVICPAGMATAVSAFHFSNMGTEAAQAAIVIPLEPAYPREFPFAELARSFGALRPEPASMISNGAEAEPIEKQVLATESLRQLKCATDVSAQEVQGLLLNRNSCITAAVRALLHHGDRAHAGRLLGYCAFGLQKNGYLPAGHNKWAFQGQFLTALADYYRIPGAAADETILRYTQIKSAARWIMRKRREVAHSPTKPRGLLPPGLTPDGVGAEFQLADNLWALEGLEAAKDLARLFGEHSDAETFHADAIKYAAQVSAAIHRELEYGITQQVPGRLHRAFDAAGASELLDIALTDEARPLLKPLDWLPRLTKVLAEPLPGPAQNGSRIKLLRMDERGLRPARRLMLHLVQHMIHGTWQSDSADIQELVTPMGAWTESLHPQIKSGCGLLFNDPEAAALYLIITARADKSKTDANNREI